MTVYYDKKRKKWRYDFTVDKERYVGYCINPNTKLDAKNRREAKVCEGDVRATIEKNGRAKKELNLNNSFILAEAAQAELKMAKNLKSFKGKCQRIGELLDFFGADTQVTDITKERIWDYVDHCRTANIKVYIGGALTTAKDLEEQGKPAYKMRGAPRKDSSIDRYLQELGRLLRVANEMTNPITKEPYLPQVPKFPKLKIPKKLPRPVAFDIVEKLYKTARNQKAFNDGKDREYMADSILLAALTGYRKRNIFDLKITSYLPDMVALRVEGEETKGNRDDYLFLSPIAQAIVEKRIRLAIEAGMEYLFFRNMRPKQKKPRYVRVKNTSTGFYTLMDKVGVKHRFHDLKATFLTSVGQINPLAVKELGRHKSAETTNRYLALIDTERKRTVEALEKFTPRLSVGDIAEIRSQIPHTEVTHGVTLLH